MKQFFRFALIALMGVAAFGCTNDIDENIASEQDMVKVFFTTDKEASRTTLDENLKVLWSDSDQLRVLYGSSYNIADPAPIVTNNGTSATFQFTLPAGSKDQALYAVYPYFAGGYGGYNGQLYGVPIKSTQTLVDGGFADGSNTSIACLNWTGSEYVGTMVNVGGIIAVKVTGDVNITKAVLTSKGSKVMAGTGTAYNISSGSCAWDGIYNTSNPTAIELTATTAINCASGVELMFVAAPNDYSGGFTLSITNDSNVTKHYDLSAEALGRAKILDLDAVTLNPADYAGSGVVIDLRGTYSIKKIASKWARADATQNMGTTIMTVEDSGFQPEAAPAKGQKYAVIYEDNGYDNMVLYFDVATVPNEDGTYDLVDLQDRASEASGGNGYDPITHNASYYDPATGYIYFDFIRAGYWAPGVAKTPLENEGDEPGYGYSYVFYTGTLPSHAIVGNYTVEYVTSQFNATPNTSHHIGTTIFDALTNADASSDTLTNTAFGSPKGNQEFKLRYWWNMSIYFDLATKTNADGTIDIINLIDREWGYDTVSHNGSYYDPATGKILIDFVLLANSAPNADTVQAPYTLPGYAFCALLTPVSE